MIDHLGFPVSDYERAKAFYAKALAPLGYSLIMEVTQEQTGFWIGTGDHLSGPVHVAFTASSRAEVDGFYKAALSVGGRDNGAPGVRAHYHPNYYGAFVLDPDGNNVEVVCHSPA